MNFGKQNNTTKIRWQRVANTAFWLAVIYVCWYKLWLSAALPFSVPMRAPHDGTWFLKAALSIHSGHWFGDTYTHYTLIKAPVYPLFLSFLAGIGIHPKIALDILYIGASLIFLAAMRLTIHNRLALFLGFIIVLANPITFSDYWTTLLRLNLFIPLVLIYLSSIFALIVYAYRDEPSIPMRWSVLCALSLALAWYTREEAIWLVAALAPMLLLSARCLWKKQQRRQVFVFWLLLVLAPYSLGALVSSINRTVYGFDGVQDTRAPEFGRALDAIYSLNTANDSNYRYMTVETRDKLRAISENTRDLIEPLIDEQDGGYAHFDKGIPGSFASWSIRSSMSYLGYYRDPERTELAYKAIADDINQYCLQSVGSCRKTYVSGVLVKPVSWERFSTLIQNSVLSTLELAPFKPADRVTQKNRDDLQYQRGDLQYQYVVNRLFNFNTSWDEALDEEIGILKVEEKRIRKINRIYNFYHNNFYIMLLIAVAGSFAAIFFSKQLVPKLIGLLLFGSVTASYSVYLLITLFAVPGFDRLLAIVFISLLSFTGYFIALTLQSCVDWFATKFKVVFNKSSIP